MSALGANRTSRDGGNDVNDPKRKLAALVFAESQHCSEVRKVRGTCRGEAMGSCAAHGSGLRFKPTRSLPIVELQTGGEKDLLCGCWSSVNHSQKAALPIDSGDGHPGAA